MLLMKDMSLVNMMSWISIVRSNPRNGPVYKTYQIKYKNVLVIFPPHKVHFQLL